MVSTASNVMVGVTGAVHIAPQATALPTNTTTALNAAFEDVGYISEDGVTQSIGTSTTNIKAWQNGDVVRKIQTEHDLTFQFTMIETSDVTLAAYYGNYAAGAIEVNSDELAHKSWVLEVADGSDDVRITIPDGQITERGDIVYQNGDAVGYQVTISCFPDSSGNKAYIYVSGTGS